MPLLITPAATHSRATAAGLWVALGIVYGDTGPSPLYTVRGEFVKPPVTEAVLLGYYLRMRRTHGAWIALLIGLYVTIEGSFLIANLAKFSHGGWLSVLLAGGYSGGAAELDCQPAHSQ